MLLFRFYCSSFFFLSMPHCRTFAFCELLSFAPRTRSSSNPAMPASRRTGTGTGSSWVAALLYPLLGACLWASAVGYKPVVIIHGLFDSSGDFKNLLRFINQVSGFLFPAAFTFGASCQQTGPCTLCKLLFSCSPQQNGVGN